MSLCALIQTLIYVYHVSGYFLLPSPVYLHLTTLRLLDTAPRLKAPLYRKSN